MERRKSLKRTKSLKSLTEEQKRDLHQAFRLLDDNHDGKINGYELKKMMEKMGLPAADEDVLYFLQKAGKDGDGLISEDEFFVFMNEFSNDDDLMEELLAAFKVFDKDGNGYITREELRRAMDMIGEELSDKALDDLLTSADVNKDGKIDYNEFAKMLL